MKTLWDTARALKLLFQFVHLHGQEDILGGKILNLHLKKPFRFSLIMTMLGLV